MYTCTCTVAHLCAILLLSSCCHRGKLLSIELGGSTVVFSMSLFRGTAVLAKVSSLCIMWLSHTQKYVLYMYMQVTDCTEMCTYMYMGNCKKSTRLKNSCTCTWQNVHMYQGLANSSFQYTVTIQTLHIHVLYNVHINSLSCYIHMYMYMYIYVNGSSLTCICACTCKCITYFTRTCTCTCMHMYNNYSTIPFSHENTPTSLSCHVFLAHLRAFYL